jgi:hypothetical protein
MLVTTARPSVFGIALRAWSSLFQAAGAMLLLFVITYALMVGVDVAIDRLIQLWAIPTIDSLKDIIKDNRRLPWPGIFKFMALDFATILVRAAIVAPLAVAIHRFILLDEVRRFFYLSRLTLRFSLWLVVLQLPLAILAWLILFAGAATGLVPMLVILLIAFLLLLMQTLQLFPGIAVEERARDLSARLETALERSEGMFWLNLIALTLTFLPVVLARAIAARASVKLLQHVPLLAPVGRATAGLLLVALTASAASWLYSYGAHKKNAPAAPVSSPAAPAS